MTSIRKVALACMTAAMVTISVNAGAQTGPANQDTFFTFSQAVELPKTTLPAGTYFFQLMDSPSNRHIVKVMSQDRKQLFATLMAIPFYSNDRPSDKPEVRFMETPATAGASAANAIKIWFYPGNSTGHEFIYPRSQAMKIAARTGESVLTTKTESEDSELSRVDRNGADAEMSAQASTTTDTATTQTATTQTATTQTDTTQTASAQPQREPVGAITGSSDQTPAAQSAPAPAPAPERTARASRTDLPHTAGFLPLLGLMGFGSLVGSRMMRRARR